jgi:FMN-dependent NADH-azoreductase
MTTLFRLDSSIRVDGSATRALADRVEHALTAAQPAEVIRRDVGTRPVSAEAWSASASAGAAPEDRWTDEQRSGRALAAALGDELARSDAFVFAAPLYNWGVSQHLKTWADLVITDPRFAPRTTTVAGRPAVLVVARGGDYREESPQAEWDHATGWMRRVLQDVWGLDLRLVEVHLTLAPHRPYLAHLRADAESDRARALLDADAAGAELVRALGAAA